MRRILLGSVGVMLAAVVGVSVAQGDATVQGPTAQFFRVSYSGQMNLPISTEAKRYSVMMLQAPNKSLVSQLHAANPNLKVYMYQSMLETNTNDPSGNTTCTAYSSDNSSHPNWFLKDQYGHRIQQTNYPGRYLMDMGNANYQSTCMSRAVTLAKASGFNGIFFDDLDASARWRVPAGTTIPAYRDDTAWQAGSYSWITYAAGHSSGVPVLVNIGGASPALWAKWCKPFAGCEEESWTDGGLGTAQQIPYWTQKIWNAAWTVGNGKTLLLHSYNTTQAGNVYGLASMLLIGNGRATYTVSNGNYSTYEVWYPEYTTAQQLGAPTGGFTKLSNGVYRRPFANGVVLVNPTSSTVGRFPIGGGTYSGSGLSNVTSTSMGPTSGLILKRVSG